MRRWIAVFAVLALAALVAAYVALFPLAPHSAHALYPALSRLDDTAAEAVALTSRSVATLIPLGTGVVLALLLAMTGRGTDPAASERRRMPGPGRVSGGSNRPDPDHVWRAEPDPVEPAMDHVPGLSRYPDIAAEAPRTSAPTPAPSAPPLFPEPETPAEPIYTPPPRPIVLARKRRERTTREQDWFDETSWFGGLPRLGRLSWPEDEHGSLPFAAQIDLATIAAVCPESPLPKSGSLAFFLGTGAVIEVPEDMAPFTEPPNDLPPAFDEGGYPLPSHSGPLSRPFFPFWPVEPLTVDLPAALLTPDSVSGVHAAEARQEVWLAQHIALSEDVYAAAEPGARLWWHGAMHLADCLHMAKHGATHLVATERERGDLARKRLARLENDHTASIEDLDEARTALAACQVQLPAILAEQTRLTEMVAAMDGFIAGRDPWAPLDTDEIGVLGDVLQQVQHECGSLVRFYVPETLGELTTLSLRAMMTGDARAFAQVPDAELERINSGHRLAIRHQHQLFGPGAPRPPEARYPHDEVLLLQLGFDDMMEWNWGHKGLFQFRLSAEDIAERRWNRVTLTFLPE